MAKDLPQGNAAPHHLINCERLQPVIDCEKVEFVEFLELMRTRRGSCVAEPVVHPTGILKRLCRLKDKRDELLAKYQLLGAALETRNEKITQFPYRALLVLNTRNNARTRAALQTKPATGKDVPKIKAAVQGRATAKGRAGVAPAWTPLRIPELETPASLSSGPMGGTPQAIAMAMKIGGGAGLPGHSLSDIARELLETVRITLPDALEPTVGVRITYEQKWCSQGYTRGRLVRSIPLTAGGKQEIVVKSWTIRKERREHNESVQEDVSTEFVGDEKASLAVAKQTSATLNSGVNANLSGNLGVTIPVKQVPVNVGADAGAGGEASSTISQSVTETKERISQTTFKAASRLQKTLSSTVETSEEAGLEATVTETIVNPNKCHTLNYHYFEVAERWQVSTRVEAIDPHILLPLPLPAFTKAFLLCHECLLRKYIPCDSYHRGFEAARRLLVNEQLGEFQGSLAGEEFDAFADQLLDELGKLLSIYYTLSNAGLGIGGAAEAEGGELWSDAWGVVEEEWNDFWEDPAGYVEDKGKEVVDAVVEGAKNVTDMAEDALKTTVDGAANLWGGLFPQARMAPAAMGAHGFFQVQQAGPGGIGSYIYWQVLKITAPEIDSALAGLASAYDHLRSMPAGPARTRALFETLKAFFAAIGDVDAAFKKVDQGLYFLMAGTVLGVAAGAGLIAALAVTVAAVSGGAGLVVAVAAALGAGAVTALTALGATIAAAIADQSGLVDLTPDDRGLKSAIQGLYGLFQQFGHAMSLPAPPQEGSSPEVIAAYYRELEERQREQRELAESAVELDRLICYLERNRLYFAQIVAANMGEDRLRALLDHYQIPPQAVAPRISGFVGARAAFRILDLQWLALAGVDFKAILKGLRDSKPITDATQPLAIVLPTRGLVVEPALGECDACDDFIQKHKALDLENRSAEVREQTARARQEELEADRFERRLQADLFDDPTPYEGSAVTVHVNEEAP